MKQSNFKLFAGMLAVLSAAALAYSTSPSLRATVQQQSQAWTNWTEESRRRDPVGFASFVERRLNVDLEKLQGTRQEMLVAVGQLNRKIDDYEALESQAQELAGEFRTAFQNASSNGGFPATIRQASYSESQLVDQVSLVLAEAEGYKASLDKMRKTQQQAEEKLEMLAVRIDGTESQLAMIATQRELLRSRELSREGEQLVAKLDELFDGNSQAVAGNPVRTVRELVAANSRRNQRANVDVAREFLAVRVETKAEKPRVNSHRKPKQEVSIQLPVQTQEPFVVGKPRVDRQDAKPIFTQN